MTQADGELRPASWLEILPKDKTIFGKNEEWWWVNLERRREDKEMDGI